MDLGSAFVTVRDGEWLNCEVVWTGRSPFYNPEDGGEFEHAMPSSLLAAGSVQPAKRCIKAQAPSGLIRHTAVGAGPR